MTEHGQDRREEAPEPSARITVDMKIPLWGMISAIGVGMFMAIGMYFTLLTQTDAIKDLQIAVKAGNNSVTALVNAQNLIALRMDTAELAIKRNTDDIQSMHRTAK